MLDDQLPQRRRRSKDQASHRTMRGDVQSHCRAEAGGGDEDGLAVGFFGQCVVCGDGRGCEVGQSGAAARSAKAWIIHRPHFDWFLVPAAAESAGIPLSGGWNEKPIEMWSVNHPGFGG